MCHPICPIILNLNEGSGVLFRGRMLVTIKMGSNDLDSNKKNGVAYVGRNHQVILNLTLSKLFGSQKKLRNFLYNHHRSTCVYGTKINETTTMDGKIQ